MNVLIVGRTKMGGASRCIGGLAQDGRSIRLLTDTGGNWDNSAPFQVGQIWDVKFRSAASPTPPHTEDVLVSRYEPVGDQPNLRAHLLGCVAPWRGGIHQVFNGMLDYTVNNNGYVCQRRGVPPQSTGFWVPDQALSLRGDGKHYDYRGPHQTHGLSYVGEPPPPPKLAAGVLLRVSLARWWRPDDAEPEFEERCYLQLSGWFL
jgi:hypothetical protein